MGSVPRKRLELRDDERLLSPPIVGAPLYQCATAVTVYGFVPDATLDIEVAGAVVVAGAPGGFPNPVGRTIPLPAALTAGQVVRARQTFAGVTSGWSAPVTVRDHTVDYPAGPPRPEINPAPVYECGSRTGVRNLLTGCNVWITADGVEVGRVNGAGNPQGVNVNPDYALNQRVEAWADLCGDPSPPSIAFSAQPGPSPLPTPGFLDVYEGSRQVTVTDLANGARFTLARNSVDQGTWRTWGYRHLVALNPPLMDGETLSATQRLCARDPASPSGTTTVKPCSALPAPEVAPIQDGDIVVRLLNFVPDARIKVFINFIKVGDGSGPVVALTRAVQHGDTIHVLQTLGTCVSDWVWEEIARCVAPPVGSDPADLNLFPVGFTTYDGGVANIRSRTHAVRGTIYYPAQTDGVRQPFNQRLASLGRVPLVVLVHGRHGGTTSHLGYEYFQRQLARMGMVAASVDCNASDGWGGWTDNIRDRAEIVLKSIAHLQALDAGADPIFTSRIDFGRTALMGHSRGGEAVIVVPEIITLPGVTIRGVISLAPVDAGASSGSPTGYDFLTILPAADGDVYANDGAKFYDRSLPTRFRCQLYVHKGNHNYFNSEWLNDDTNGGLAVMPRADHERILSAYGCAFFRNVLLGHDTLGYLVDKVRPPGVAPDAVHLSFTWTRGPLTVDNHEDGNGIGLNSLGQPTAASGGLTADEHPFAHTAATRFNDSFWGATIGMVASTKEVGGIFRTALNRTLLLGRNEIWVRAAEVYNGRNVPPGATGFQMGVETTTGTQVWVDSDDVGGLPRPQDRRAYDLPQWYAEDATKTMPKTLRFPAACFRLGRRVRVRALLLRMNRSDGRALAFDDLQIVSS